MGDDDKKMKTQFYWKKGPHYYLLCKGRFNPIKHCKLAQ